MVLELCELLSELAERRASALADCTAANPQVATMQTTTPNSISAAATPIAVVAEIATSNGTAAQESSSSIGRFILLSDFPSIMDKLNTITCRR
ncbi:unnamed protein product [Protopolystoma xenopodis]|uniref:Uncharacterized protein n=1 Tax=Protopolystoma xenopodis TaxID=117903 RepID=A0A3S5AI88_9PLAT|nr:unnamed protein product [Protopolystoma xenopodis]